MAAASRFAWATSVILTSSLLFFGAGCSNQAPPPTPQQLHLKSLAVLYGRFVGSHRGFAPTDEKSFKTFIDRLPPAEKKALGVEQVDLLFTSPRDSQPYVIVYGGRLGAPDSKGAPIIAYEQSGENGRRMVATALGAVYEADDEQWMTIAANLPTKK